MRICRGMSFKHRSTHRQNNHNMRWPLAGLLPTLCPDRRAAPVQLMDLHPGDAVDDAEVRAAEVWQTAAFHTFHPSHASVPLPPLLLPPLLSTSLPPSLLDPLHPSLLGPLHSRGLTAGHM
eukprot:356200-Chlamydomonas_euryale.AAC.1